MANGLEPADEATHYTKGKNFKDTEGAVLLQGCRGRQRAITNI
ncbi:hypothetical protein S7335_5582 [Synechococcus sp. PCC 7335]|nr:hypothetical protein S7335_5582 [Synechococcus sp. PCC 7335]